MNFKKTLLLATIFAFINVRSVFAADITVTCDSSDCVMSPSAGAALFDESEFPQYDMKPGDRISRHLTLVNNSSDACNLILHSATIDEQSPADFSTRLHTAISEGSTDIYGVTDSNGATAAKNLSDLLTTDFPSLGIIPAGETRDLTWYVNFDWLTGNEYQGARLVFDFDMNFSCGNPDITPTPTPNPTPTPDNGGGNNGGGDNGGGNNGGTGPAPVCNDEKPSGAPSNFRATAQSTNSITLAWNPVSPATHYALVFTRISDGAAYGAANIGNVTSYTINNLSGSANYRFEIFAVNGCMPGDRSYLGPVAISGPVIYSRPIGEDGQTLGVKEEATASATPKATTTPIAGKVAGEAAQGCCPKICPWWWFMLVAQALVLTNYFIKKSAQTKEADWLIVSMISFIAFFLGHLILHYLFINNYGYQENRFCPLYWLFSLLSIAIIDATYLFIKKENKK